jgi:cell division protein FtsW
MKDSKRTVNSKRPEVSGRAMSSARSTEGLLDWANINAGGIFAGRKDSFSKLSIKYSLKLSRRRRADYGLMISVFLLTAIGILTLYAIGPAVLSRTGSGLMKQSMLLCIGIILMFLIYKFKRLEVVIKYAPHLFAVSIVLCVLILTPLGKVVYGGRRWIDLGLISLQPSEILKAATVFFFAGILDLFKPSDDSNKQAMTVMAIFGVIALFVLFLQRDLGTMLVFAIIGGFMLIYSRTSWRVIFKVAGTGLLMLAFSMLAFGYRRERLLAFIGSGNTKTAQGLVQESASDYHLRQSLIAVGGGGLYGKGVGKSVQSFGYLPEAPSDSIFAVYAEKFGFVGSMVVSALFFILITRTIKISAGLGPYWGTVVVGIAGWLAGNFAINLGSILGIVPFTGVPLPFFSLGGTNLIVILCMVGVVLNLSTYRRGSQR